MLEKFPQAHSIADVIPVNFETLPSTALEYQHWRRLVVEIEKLVAEHQDLVGVAILHGTATIEETAYALNLALKVDIPVVITGSQRPASALSSDAGLNVFNAVRVASCPEARGKVSSSASMTKSMRHAMSPKHQQDDCRHSGQPISVHSATSMVTVWSSTISIRDNMRLIHHSTFATLKCHRESTSRIHTLVVTAQRCGLSLRSAPGALLVRPIPQGCFLRKSRWR